MVELLFFFQNRGFAYRHVSKFKKFAVSGLPIESMIKSPLKSTEMLLLISVCFVSDPELSHRKNDQKIGICLI